MPLSVAIATRRSLPLRLAKLRASGRLVELGPPELSLTAGECEELLRFRRHDPVGPDEVEAVLAASEGWPMGVALTGLAGSGEATPGPVSQDELFHYLAEEVLDRLDPRTRLALLDSSVPDALTPELGDALGLPPGFLDEAERSGLFLRTSALRRPLLPPAVPRLPARAAARSCAPTTSARSCTRARPTSLVASGRQAEAIEHWLEAGRYEQAL